MSDLPQGYQDIPEEDRKKAQAFFDRGKSVADAGQYDYAITMFLQGIAKDPENTDAHQALREISMRRKASGGKDLGFMEKMGLKKPAKDDKENLINAEKLLCYDVGNVGNMLGVAQAAYKGGFYDTAMWAAQLAMAANVSAPKGPDFKTFIALKDIYKSLLQWPQAAEACSWAAKLRPDDMNLAKEARDIGAQQTMTQGKYGVAKSFRDSVRDMDKQRELMEGDTDVRTADQMKRQLATAEAEWKAEPNEPGKLMKYVEVLRKTETPEFENKAIEVLEDAFNRTHQFRFRKAIGEVKLAQLKRMERSLRTNLQKDPSDEDLKKQYQQFLREKVEEELAEYTLWADNYPTETQFRFDMAQRLFQLGRFDEAIPIFQQARQDPKYRVDAATLLGRAFMEAGFLDEAVDTMRDAIEAYPIKGDAKSIDMTYYFGRALEGKGDVGAALKQYSQVAQWSFNYRDVQVRIKALRPKPTA
jgi:tetratricopeptide (TPR) repeat protein